MLGDIGCYSLGMGPSGFGQMKTLHAMGSGAGLACGFGKLKAFGLSQPVMAVCGDSTFSNMAMLGAFCAVGILPLDRGDFEAAISELLPARRLRENMEAFDRGGKAVREMGSHTEHTKTTARRSRNQIRKSKLAKLETNPNDPNKFLSFPRSCVGTSAPDAPASLTQARERQSSLGAHAGAWAPGLKSRKRPISVIPVKTGIQGFRQVTKHPDPGFHRGDDFLRVRRI
ncbi:MAG: 2-oxoacid:acceptor oxidoreductase family protein [Thermodesulfobacteriota bacterium]